MPGIVLTGSVGRSGRNLRNDVSLVQLLLLYNPGADRTRLSVTGTCDQATIEAIEAFQRRSGRTVTQAGTIQPVGEPLRTLLDGVQTSSNFADALRKMQAMQNGPVPSVDQIAPGGGPNQKYTDNPNEVARTTTTLRESDVADALRQAWPALSVDGAHLLVAQYVLETGGGKSCHNFNLGNMKPKSTDELHVYLPHVWEVEAPLTAQSEVIRAKGLARLASPSEIAARGRSVSPGQVLVIYTPPDRGARFAAYRSLAEAAVAWTAKYRRDATAHPELLGAINRGDCDGYANALKRLHYYTAAESEYARQMKSIKIGVDHRLGKS